MASVYYLSDSIVASYLRGPTYSIHRERGGWDEVAEGEVVSFRTKPLNLKLAKTLALAALQAEARHLL